MYVHSSVWLYDTHIYNIFLFNSFLWRFIYLSISLAKFFTIWDEFIFERYIKEKVIWLSILPHEVNHPIKKCSFILNKDLKCNHLINRCTLTNTATEHVSIVLRTSVFSKNFAPLSLGLTSFVKTSSFSSVYYIP